MIRNQINSAWQSVFAGSGGIQNVGGTDIHVYEGGAAPDASSPYVVLGPRQYWVNEKPAAVVYVRCTQGKGFVTSYNIGSSSTGVVGSMVTVVEMYVALAVGTGYVGGDKLRRTEIIDNLAGTSTVTWFNITTQTPIAAPSAAQITQQPATGLTDTELRATPVDVADADTVAKLEELRLQLVSLLGSTENIETLQTNANNLVTLTNQYVDGLETLIATLSDNNDTIEPLLSTIQGYVDTLEPLLTDIKALATTDATKQDTANTLATEIRDRLPATLGAALAAQSLAVVLATDSALPLPTGAATEAKQDLGNTSLDNIDAKLPVQGEALGANSMPVVLATDQVLPLPTGAATEAKQDAQTSLLATIDADVAAIKTSAASVETKLPSQGQKPASGSLPVILASDQTLPLPNGAATADNQATEIEKLTSIEAKLPVLGQAAKAASVPVALASDQDVATGAKQDAQTLALTAIKDDAAEIRAQVTSLNTNLPAPGKKASAASLPVVLASDSDHAKDATVDGVRSAVESAKTSVDSVNAKLPAALGMQTPANSLSVVVANQSSSGVISTGQLYIAVGTGNGYTLGDNIRRLDVIDTIAGTTATSWQNLTSGASISQPIASDIEIQASNGLTDAELRATPLATADADALAKLEELRAQLVGIFGNTDTVETLVTQTNTLLTTLSAYNDGVEGLLTSLGTNTDGLESLLGQISGYVDAVEPMLSEVRDRLPATVGQKLAAESLSVAIAGDQDIATSAKQDDAIAVLSSIRERLPPAIGKQSLASSLSVIVANQLLDVATVAKQDEAIAKLAALVGKLPSALGPKPEADSLSVVLSSGMVAQRTPSLLTATTSGFVFSGAVSVSFFNNGSVPVVVAGGNLDPGMGCSFDARFGDKLGTIGYTVNGAGASLMITTLF